MASPGKKEFSISESERKLVTEEQVALRTTGKDTFTVDQGINILGTYLKDMANDLSKNTTM